jgi:hypothetical protein
VLHIYKVDMTDVLRVKHARHNAQPSARQQQQQDGSTAAVEAAALRALQAAGGNSNYTDITDFAGTNGCCRKLRPSSCRLYGTHVMQGHAAVAGARRC